MTNEDIRPVRIGKLLLPAILALAIPFAVTALSAGEKRRPITDCRFRRRSRARFLHAVATVVADLNHDGRQDVVVAHINGKVGVMLGNGDGTLQAETTYATGASYQAAWQLQTSTVTGSLTS